jgi:hypothetical protein
MAKDGDMIRHTFSVSADIWHWVNESYDDLEKSQSTHDNFQISGIGIRYGMYRPPLSAYPESGVCSLLNPTERVEQTWIVWDFGVCRWILDAMPRLTRNRSIAEVHGHIAARSTLSRLIGRYFWPTRYVIRMFRVTASHVPSVRQSVPGSRKQSNRTSHCSS